MDQSEVNSSEWNNLDNWAGPKWLSVYFSKNDTRVWVPKQLPWTGWTLNLGRAAGVGWLVIIMFAIAFAPLAVAMITGALG